MRPTWRWGAKGRSNSSVNNQFSARPWASLDSQVSNPPPLYFSLSDSISPPTFYLSISHLNFLLRFITLIFSSFRAPDHLAAVDPSSLAAADQSSNAAANASMEAKDDDIIEGKATDIISPKDDLSETVTENPADASDENIRFVTEMAFTLTENENLD